MINYKRFAAIPIMVALASCAGNDAKEALIDNTTTEGQVAQVQQTNSIIPVSYTHLTLPTKRIV